jgi:hypothetical protein
MVAGREPSVEPLATAVTDLELGLVLEIGEDRNIDMVLRSVDQNTGETGACLSVSTPNERLAVLGNQDDARKPLLLGLGLEITVDRALELRDGRRNEVKQAENNKN